VYPLDHDNFVIPRLSYLDMGPGPEPLTVSFNGPSLMSGVFGSSVHDGKNMIVKIQDPLEGSGDLLVYNEKRTFKCVVSRRTNPTGYDRTESVIKKKGMYGTKGYFAAKPKSNDKLIVKIVELSDGHRF